MGLPPPGAGCRQRGGCSYCLSTYFSRESLKICFPDSTPAEKADSTDDNSKKSDTGPKRRHEIGQKYKFKDLVLSEKTISKKRIYSAVNGAAGFRQMTVKLKQSRRPAARANSDSPLTVSYRNGLQLNLSMLVALIAALAPEQIRKNHKISPNGNWDASGPRGLLYTGALYLSGY